MAVAGAALSGGIARGASEALPNARLIVRTRAGLTPGALQRVLARHGVQRTIALDAIDAAVIAAPIGELGAVESALRRSGVFRSVERDHVAHIADDPNDSYYSAQWGVTRIGAPAAWTITGGSGVTVAVLDTGVDVDHPDLRGDVVPGYDFVNDDPDPSDDHGHGTRMSGIIVAQRDNGIGVAGIAPEATLMPVKVLDADGYGAYSAVASGIVFAVDRGARVLNLSLAGPVRSDLLQDAVSYATAREAVVVAAAGNYGSDAPMYPAAALGATAVGAINEANLRPVFSGYGPWLSLVAPGVDIVTTSLGGTYTTSSGTSPAAAFVSGTFALLLAAEPTLSQADAVVRVQRAALDLGSRGWDPFYGWGSIDAYGTLVPGETGVPLPDDGKPDIAILSPVKRSLCWGDVPVDVIANDRGGIDRVELLIDNRRHAIATTPPFQFVLEAGDFAPGPHKLRADAYDRAGNYGRSKTVKVTFTPGVGVLVDRAVARERSLTVTARFALPEGVSFDPAVDALRIVLRSAAGTVLSVVAQAGTLSGRGGVNLRARGTLAALAPTSGRVRVVAKGSARTGVYVLKVKAADLDSMAQLQPLASLDLEIGGVQLSQALTLRLKGSTWTYP